jgi:hypothetical protein
VKVTRGAGQGTEVEAGRFRRITLRVEPTEENGMDDRVFWVLLGPEGAVQIVATGLTLMRHERFRSFPVVDYCVHRPPAEGEQGKDCDVLPGGRCCLDCDFPKGRRMWARAAGPKWAGHGGLLGPPAKPDLTDQFEEALWRELERAYEGEFGE